MSLNECYKKATLYPSIIIILGTLVFSIIENYNYKSEWLTGESVIFLAIITAIVYCLIVSLLSLTIFLNKFKKVNENSVLIFLSWFSLPFGFITIVFIHEINLNIKYEEKGDSDLVYIVIFNLPFILGLIWSYYKYQKLNFSGEDC